MKREGSGSPAAKLVKLISKNKVVCETNFCDSLRGIPAEVIQYVLEYSLAVPWSSIATHFSLPSAHKDPSNVALTKSMK